MPGIGRTMHDMASPVAATAPLPALRLALVALAGAGLAAGLAFLALVLDSDHTDDRGVAAAVGLLVGWSFIGTGLFAWWRRPGNRTGALMVAVGFAWFATGVSASNEDLVFIAGIALDALLFAFAGHLLLAFPGGRLQTNTERGIVAASYLVVTVLQAPPFSSRNRIARSLATCCSSNRTAGCPTRWTRHKPQRRLRSSSRA